MFAYLLDPGIILNIQRKLRFSHPTKIQFATMEDFQLSMHLFIAAETGSGKTIAFGAPVLSELLKQKEKGDNSKGKFIFYETFFKAGMFQLSYLL